MQRGKINVYHPKLPLDRLLNDFAEQITMVRAVQVAKHG